MILLTASMDELEKQTSFLNNYFFQLVENPCMPKKIK
jgi:hypothetical protein